MMLTKSDIWLGADIGYTNYSTIAVIQKKIQRKRLDKWNSALKRDVEKSTKSLIKWKEIRDLTENIALPFKYIETINTLLQSQQQRYWLYQYFIDFAVNDCKIFSLSRIRKQFDSRFISSNINRPFNEYFARGR